MLGCYYGLTSHLFALCPSLLSFGFLTLVWPNGQAELFSATPSISVKRRTIFAELCAITYIFCAALSLLFRLYSGKFNYGGSLLHLQKQTITVICKLDLASSLAFIIAHVTGHHDICDRIHRRLLRLGRALRITCWSLYLVLYATLQELPRELESQHSLEHVSLIDVENPVDSAFLPAPLIPSPAAMGLTTSEHQNQRGNDICKVDVLDRANERRKFPLMRQLSSDPYTAVHQGFRSIRAQVRWSSLRYRLQFQRQPLPEFLVMIASQIRSNRLEVELRYSNAVPPPVQILPFRSGPFTDHPPLFAALVMNILPQQPGTRHNEQRWRPLPFGGQIPTSSTRRNAALMTPIFQLPGTIQNISVKALPDTGSSQNVIDLSLVDNLFPAVTIQPFDPTDKPLVAPDGELIPCVGKALLPWMFKLGNKVYKKWFYIVNGCSHGVIIGNGFLDETETMNKHQERLEITEPVEPEPIVGKLVSEAQQDDCLRQIVLGTINGEKAAASLDTGCQANLMSASYAQQLNLEIYPPTVGCQLVEFANGRKGPTLGQVEFSWTFADKPDEEIFVKCHVLSKCIHSVIFGDRFIHSEKPWERHEKSLSQIRTNTADLLAVGLHRSFWPFKKAKPGRSIRFVVERTMLIDILQMRRKRLNAGRTRKGTIGGQLPYNYFSKVNVSSHNSRLDQLSHLQLCFLPAHHQISPLLSVAAS